MFQTSTTEEVRTILTCSNTKTIEQTFTDIGTDSPADRQVSANSSSAFARFIFSISLNILRYTKFLTLLLPLLDIKKKEKDAFKLAETLPTGALSAWFSSWLSGHVRVTLPCETSS